MRGVKFILAITKREYEENYLDFFRKHGVENVTSLLCNGTATQSVLDLLGVEKTEQVMLTAMVRNEDINILKNDLRRDMDISAAGNGVAVFIPVDSFGGNSSLKYYVGEKPIENKENEEMANTDSKVVMIIALVDKGNTDLVMDAARSAGASGGTVLRAKGTGAKIAKFFGVTISEEKEIVHIIAVREARDSIMKAIMEKAGNNTSAHGVLFSLPVDSVVGLSAFENL